MNKHGKIVHALGEPRPGKNVEHPEGAPSDASHSQRGKKHPGGKISPQASEISHKPQSSVDVDGDGGLETYSWFVSKSTSHRVLNFYSANGEAAEDFDLWIVLAPSRRRQ